MPDVGFATYSRSVRVRDLGPLLVEAGGVERSCPGPKQAAILATLAMHANRRVAVEDLVVAGWGYDATASASSVENHLWRLRRLLEPDRPGTSCLVSETGGYRLVIATPDVDSHRFEHLAATTAEELAPDETLRRCDEALGLWRGAPYEIVSHATGTAAVVARLEELRGQVAERRLEALLTLGHPERVLADVEPLLAEHPYRERCWALRMTALARLGRTEEALATYRRVRDLLRDELGLDPGPALRALHRAVMSQDDVPPAAPPHRPVVDVHLPTPSGALIGRERESGELAALLARSRLTTVVGPGGCGKTRLAIDVARREADRFPDGVRFVDLTQVVTGRPVADMIVSVLGLASDGAGASAALRGFVRDRCALLVLDNSAHVNDATAQLVGEILTPEARTTVLATSREPLDLVTETAWGLAPLSPPAAARLFRDRVGVGTEAEAVERICAAVDGLPLAVELAAARARTFTVAEIAEQVARDPGGLGRVGRGPADHRRTVREAIEWSHRLLGVDEQAVHRALSVLPGPFTLPVAAAVIGPALEVSAVPTVLARLAHRCMLVATPGRDGRPTTFRQLDTVRAHGRHHLAAAGEEAATLALRDAWVRGVLAARPRLGRPEEAGWYDLVEESFPIARATLDDLVAAPTPDPRALRLGAELVWFGYYRTRVHEIDRWLEHAVPHTGPEGPDGLTVRFAHAAARILLGDLEGGRPLLVDALTRLEALEPAAVHSSLAEVVLTAAGSCWTHNAWDLVARSTTGLAHAAGGLLDPDVALVLDAMTCAAGLGASEADELDALTARTSAVHERALARDNVCATWICCAVLNIVALLTRDPDAGVVWTERLIVATRRLGPGGTGVYVEAMANFLVMRGEHTEALHFYSSAHTQTRRAGMVWPARPQTAALIEAARDAIPPAEHRRAWEEGAALTTDEVLARYRAGRASELCDVGR